MATKAEVDLAFTGRDQGAGSLIDRLGKKLKDFKKEERQSGEGALERTIAGGGRGIAEGLGDLAGIAKVGIGLAIVDQIGKAGEASVKLFAEWRSGAKTGAEVADSMARQLPAVGALYGFFRGIRNELDGSAKAAREEAEAIKEAEAAAKRRAEATAFNKKLKDDGDQQAKSDRDEEVGLQGLGAFGEQRARAEYKLQDRLDQIEKDRQQAREKLVGGEQKAALARLQGQETQARNLQMQRLVAIDKEEQQKREEDDAKAVDDEVKRQDEAAKEAAEKRLKGWELGEELIRQSRAKRDARKELGDLQKELAGDGPRNPLGQGINSVALSGRFTGLADSFKDQAAAAREAHQERKRQTNILEKIRDTNEKLLDLERQKNKPSGIPLKR